MNRVPRLENAGSTADSAVNVFIRFVLVLLLSNEAEIGNGLEEIATQENLEKVLCGVLHICERNPDEDPKFCIAFSIVLHMCSFKLL